MILGEGFEYPVLDIIEKFSAESSSRGLLKCSDEKRYTATTKKILVLLAASFITIPIFIKTNLFALSALSVRHFYDNTQAFKYILVFGNRIIKSKTFIYFPALFCLSSYSIPSHGPHLETDLLSDIFQSHANTNVENLQQNLNIQS